MISKRSETINPTIFLVFFDVLSEKFYLHKIHESQDLIFNCDQVPGLSEDLLRQSCNLVSVCFNLFVSQSSFKSVENRYFDLKNWFQYFFSTDLRKPMSSFFCVTFVHLVMAAKWPMLVGPSRKTMSSSSAFETFDFGN